MEKYIKMMNTTKGIKEEVEVELQAKASEEHNFLHKIDANGKKR